MQRTAATETTIFLISESSKWVCFGKKAFLEMGFLEGAEGEKFMEIVIISC
jgi:hypothetical protein